MTVDLPLRAYLEALATPPGAPGAERATAVAAALAAAKTRATGLAQRARRAEAEFLAAMATAGTT